MEIPYVVTPRKDTGLFNSKIAIWLFLASEVMLFGGFFSAYVFLRLGADYPWPERTLPVLPGLINTFVLIFSSVTVVFAWASLKLRNWNRFRIFMSITVICAGVFMVLKGVEYYVKFHHQALRLTDYAIVEGHLGKEVDENGKLEIDHNGHEIEENFIHVLTDRIAFDTVRYYEPWVKEALSKAEHEGAKIVLADDITVITGEAMKTPVKIATKGEPLTFDLLERIRGIHLDARSHNAALRTAALRQEWKAAKKTHEGIAQWKYASEVNIDDKALKPRLLGEIPSIAFAIEPPIVMDFPPRDIKEGEERSVLRDDTVVEGKLLESPVGFHHVDAIDFQYLVMKAAEKGIEPEPAIENSWLMKNVPFVRGAWQWHLDDMDKLRASLVERYGRDDHGLPNRVPTHKELYRIGWDDLTRYAVDRGHAKVEGIASYRQNFLGPNYEAWGDATFPAMEIPREKVGFTSKFTPAWNTYYAIYFTITGLHGLHVIGGALVLAYYLFFGRKMYLSNPEWLANRVEIGGLFWHFVDLVWIFVFPILYLM